MNIPLINTNDKESINTSLIAIKRATEELNNLIKIADEKMAQLDEKAKKYTDDKINALDVDAVGGSGKYISAISETDGKISATASDITSSVSSGNSQPVTSGGVAEAIAGQNGIYISKYMNAVGWIKVCSIENWARGNVLELYLTNNWNSAGSSARKITLIKGTSAIGVYNYSSWITVKEETSDPQILLSEIQICGSDNTTDKVFVYVKYNKAVVNTIGMSYKHVGTNAPTIYMTNEAPSGYALNVNYALHNKGVYINGVNISPTDSILDGNPSPITSGAIFSFRRGLFYDTGLLTLTDNQEKTVTLNASRMYLYINIHVTSGQELVILNCYNGVLKQTRITHAYGGSDTVITNSGQNVTFKSTSNCRGHLLLLTDFTST